MNPRARGNPLRVGVVGLGVGTLAAYVYVPWHTIRFYEINPEVSRLAETYFTYLADARERGATVEIVLGDARLSLERELKQAPQAFDVLVLDAFSSDSIPIHLLTREAFDDLSSASRSGRCLGSPRLEPAPGFGPRGLWAGRTLRVRCGPAAHRRYSERGLAGRMDHSVAKRGIAQKVARGRRQYEARSSHAAAASMDRPTAQSAGVLR